MSIGPQITQGVDDLLPRAGAISFGDFTNDASPLIRVSLGDQASAGDSLYLRDNGTPSGPAVTLSAKDLMASLTPGWIIV
jgi:hypothetical protein